MKGSVNVEHKENLIWDTELYQELCFNPWNLKVVNNDGKRLMSEDVLRR